MQKSKLNLALAVLAGGICIYAGAPAAPGDSVTPDITYSDYVKLIKTTKTGDLIAVVRPFDKRKASAIVVDRLTGQGGFDTRLALDGASWEAMSPEERSAFIEKLTALAPASQFADTKSVFVLEVPPGDLWLLTQKDVADLSRLSVFRFYTDDVVNRLPLQLPPGSGGQEDRRTNEKSGDIKKEDAATSP